MTKARKSTAAGTRPDTSLLDFKLPNGKKLGDATRGEVLKAAEHYAKRGAKQTRGNETMTRNNVVAEALIASVFAAAGAKTPEQKARAGWRFNDMLWRESHATGWELPRAVNNLLQDADLPWVDDLWADDVEYVDEQRLAAQKAIAEIMGAQVTQESFGERMAAAKAAKRQAIIDAYGPDAEYMASVFEWDARRSRVAADEAMSKLQPKNVAQHMKDAREAARTARILRDHAATVKTAA